MKYLFGILIGSLFIYSGKTPKQLFEDFRTIYAKSDSVSMKNLLASNFVGYNEKGEVSFERNQYLDYMNTWNQVFKTKWNVETYKVVGDKIESIEYDTDLYNDYFYGTKHQIKYVYRFKKNKIESLTSVTTEEGKKAEKNLKSVLQNFIIG